MQKYNIYRVWFSCTSIILCCIGIVFTIFGFAFFPPVILPRSALLPWVSGIYGSIMIGWGITLLIIGRYAYQNKNATLMKNILFGILVWLVIEAIVSFLVGVYFNIGVDLVVFLLFGLPLFSAIRMLEKKN